MYSGAARLGLELVVFGLDLGVADRVASSRGPASSRPDQDALARELHLRLVVGRRGEAAALGFLARGSRRSRPCRAPACRGRAATCWPRCGGLLLHLGDDRVDARLRHRLAVDDGDVLRLDGQRCQGGGGERRALAAKNVFFMVNVPFGRDGVDGKRGPARWRWRRRRARAQRGCGVAGVDRQGVDAARHQVCQGIIYEAMPGDPASGRRSAGCVMRDAEVASFAGAGVAGVQVAVVDDLRARPAPALRAAPPRSRPPRRSPRVLADARRAGGCRRLAGGSRRLQVARDVEALGDHEHAASGPVRPKTLKVAQTEVEKL